MPSRRVSSAFIDINLFEVIGAEGIRPGFIRHSGLASSAATHPRESVPVHDMGPPLRIAGRMQADAVGIADLTDDEARKIKDFLDRHESEHQSAQKLNPRSFPRVYCIFPHAAPLREQDGRYARTRFSCAGFVFEAYQRAGIHLFDEDQLPQISLDQIKEAYDDVAVILERPAFRELMGLSGIGPWPVMLCGYLFHSLRRDSAEIRGHPFIVTIGDEIFL
jgi:hypothetical protein